MPTKAETISAAEDQVFAALRQGQDAILRRVQARAEGARNRLPVLPSLPFARQLPHPAGLVDGAFSFADRLLESQRAFATALVAAACPEQASDEPASPEGAPKRAATTAAKARTAGKRAPRQP